MTPWEETGVTFLNELKIYCKHSPQASSEKIAPSSLLFSATKAQSLPGSQLKPMQTRPFWESPLKNWEQ